MLEQGRQAHALWIKCKISGNLVVNSALMDIYFKCSSLSEGRLVCEKFLDRNFVTWSALTSGYGHHGRVVQVIESFHRMLDEGFNIWIWTSSNAMCRMCHMHWIELLHTMEKNCRAGHWRIFHHSDKSLVLRHMRMYALLKLTLYLRNRAASWSGLNCLNMHMIFGLPYTTLQEC
ncbi:unnamed protein product [Coffea canephora]|uniref:DH200=94 genomic scaffold, scaffold_8983 n=1 Tax=Coffea canephora TaxID=49390 RepID=A0A068VQK6_COFCA|nr:unnamed protein product [Coffea canephora]